MTDEGYGYLELPPLPRQTIRQLDAAAIADFEVPGILLMENAGEGCVRAIGELLRRGDGKVTPPFQIICGFGNNAGDGLVIARHLWNRGYPVTVFLTGAREAIRPGSDTAINHDIVRSMGVAVLEPGPDPRRAIERATTSGTLIDAIFGSGLSRAVVSPQYDWIEAMNASGRTILAVDIPSGLDADSGEVLGTAIRADHTFTFVAPKLGFHRGAGPRHTGRLHVMGISIPRTLLEAHSRDVLDSGS